MTPRHAFLSPPTHRTSDTGRQPPALPVWHSATQRVDRAACQRQALKAPRATRTRPQLAAAVESTLLASADEHPAALAARAPPGRRPRTRRAAAFGGTGSSAPGAVKCRAAPPGPESTSGESGAPEPSGQVRFITRPKST